MTYTDKLRAHAIRTPDALQPGDEVIFIHGELFVVHYGTIVELSILSWMEEHPNQTLKHPEEADWAREKRLLIFYTTGSTLDSKEVFTSRHASDSGVVPYTSGKYNPVNFTVKVSDLIEAGLELPEIKRFPKLKPLQTVSELLRGENS